MHSSDIRLLLKSRGILHPPTAGRLRLPAGRQVQDDIKKTAVIVAY